MKIFKSIIKTIQKEFFDISDFHHCIINNQKEKFYDYLNNKITKRNINECNASKNNALHYACAEKNIDFIDALLQAGASTNIKNAQGQTALSLVCSSAKETEQAYMDVSKDIINLVGVKGANFTKFDPVYAKREISKKIDFKIVERLLKEITEIDTVDLEENTPLHKAIYADHLKIATALVNKGASILQKNNLGSNALSISLKYKSYDILEMLYFSATSLEQLDSYIEIIKMDKKAYPQFENTLNTLKLKFNLDCSLAHERTQKKKKL